MIITVSMNPSLDKTVSVGHFTYGGTNRVAASRVDAGGKAINVAVAASALGLSVACVGFLCAEDAAPIEEKLADFRVETEFYRLPGRVRTNLKIRDDAAGVVTELNEPGAAVDDAALAALRQVIERRLRRDDMVVLTGSLPPGCPKSFYGALVEDVARKRGRCVLDAEGEAFRLAVDKAPFLVKPNRSELETFVGHELTTRDAIRRAALALIERGVSLAAVSLGADGAMLVSRAATYFAPALSLSIKSTVGAGDSMVAGMLYALSRDADLPDVLRDGAACASASVVLEGTKLADLGGFEGMRARIEVERV